MVYTETLPRRVLHQTKQKSTVVLDLSQHQEENMISANIVDLILPDGSDRALALIEKHKLTRWAYSKGEDEPEAWQDIANVAVLMALNRESTT